MEEIIEELKYKFKTVLKEEQNNDTKFQLIVAIAYLRYSPTCKYLTKNVVLEILERIVMGEL